MKTKSENEQDLTNVSSQLQNELSSCTNYNNDTFTEFDRLIKLSLEQAKLCVNIQQKFANSQGCNPSFRECSVYCNSELSLKNSIASVNSLLDKYNYLNSGQIYLDNLPSSQSSAISDPDGKFTLKLKAGLSYVITAKGGRASPKEDYFWLVKINLKGATDFFLSNQNLLSTNCDECAVKVKPIIKKISTGQGCANIMQVM